MWMGANICFSNDFISSTTRMHSSRMRTARSSSLTRGSPLGIPHGQTPQRAGTPKDQAPRTRHPPEPSPSWEQAPLYQAPPDQAPPCGQTHTCKHITLTQTSFPDGKYGPLNKKFIITFVQILDKSKNQYGVFTPLEATNQKSCCVSAIYACLWFILFTGDGTILRWGEGRGCCLYGVAILVGCHP